MGSVHVLATYIYIYIYVHICAYMRAYGKGQSGGREECNEAVVWVPCTFQPIYEKVYPGLKMMLEERGGRILRVCLKRLISNDLDDHLEELEKQRKDQKVCDDGPDCPSSGQVGIVYHVDPIL